MVKTLLKYNLFLIFLNVFEIKYVKTNFIKKNW